MDHLNKPLENLKQQLEANLIQKYKIIGAIEVLTQLIKEKSGGKEDDRKPDVESAVAED